MGSKGRVIIFITLILALFIILAKPMLDSNNHQTEANPYQLYTSALQEGRPIFMDFYSPR